MIRKILTGKISSIASAAIVISVAGLASRVLGMLRDRALAWQFGAGVELDIYYTAFRIPDLVYNLIVLGALSAGFIPIFTSLIKTDEQENCSGNNKAWDLMSSVLNIFLLVLMIVCLILFIFTDKLMPLIAPGFGSEQLKTVGLLARIMFLSPLLLGISAIFGGALQSFKRFFVFSLAPILYNLGIIFGVVFLIKPFGLIGLAFGVILGAFCHLLIQMPIVFKLGFRYKFIFNFKDRNVREIFKLMIPRVLALATAQINLFVVTILGSMLTVGSIAIYNLANNLQSFPVGLVGISFAIAAFPALSASFSQKKFNEFNNKLQSTIRLIIFAIIPITIIFVLLRIQITRVILGTGVFDWQSTILTADTLGLFAISLFAQSLIPLFARSFYARHNTWIPFVAGLIGALINIYLSWILIDFFGVLGLALAFSISQIVILVVLATMLRILTGKFGEAQIIKSFLKIVFAAVIMGMVIQGLKYPLSIIVDMQKLWGIFLQGLIAGVSGLAVFIVICKICKCEELFIIQKGIKKRLFKNFQADSETLRKVE